MSYYAPNGKPDLSEDGGIWKPCYWLDIAGIVGPLVVVCIICLIVGACCD